MPAARNDPPRAPSRRSRFFFFYLLLGLLLLLVWQGAAESLQVRTIGYGEFKQLLAARKIKTVELNESEVRGTLAEDAQADLGTRDSLPPVFRAIRVEDPELTKQLEEAGVEFTGVLPNPFTQFLLSWILPVVFLVGLWFIILRFAAGRAGAQVMSFGKSKARLVAETGTGVSFDDVAGCDEAKQELAEMVEFLKDPARFTALGARIPTGVLLVGPPGTGKTLLARAVAGEAGVPFFSISGSNFVEMFVGVGASRVRDLFEQAKHKAPCIVFIDEIDAVGRQRGVQLHAANDEREQTLNQLLAEMDGFEGNVGVIILAATNRPEILDRALMRPGRFDRQVVLDAPDLQGREAILRVHARGKPMEDGVNLRTIAQGTPGLSGADLANAINEAALLAARRRAKRITQADLEEAVEKVVTGPERRSRRLGDSEKRRVAYHESGHALVAAHSATADPVRKISIIPRGRAALGFTLQLPEEEQFLMTRAELEDRLRVMLGGRAGESVALGEVSTGAQNDLEQATNLARQMVALYGMSDRLGLASCARPEGFAFLDGYDGSLRRDCSEETAREIDEEVKSMLDEAFSSAQRILVEHRVQLDAVAEALLEKESLDRSAFEAILARSAGGTGAGGLEKDTAKPAGAARKTRRKRTTLPAGKAAGRKKRTPRRGGS